MAKRLIPSFNRVLIEKIVPPSKTSAGILLPEKSSQLNSGKVIAVGPGSRDRVGNLIPVAVKEGDHVLLPEYGGTQIKLDDKEFHLFRDEDILGILPIQLSNEKAFLEHRKPPRQNDVRNNSVALAKANMSGIEVTSIREKYRRMLRTA
ncbi:10 kDa chaperonin, mitochondrial, partial [Mucuna pruriens]